MDSSRSWPRKWRRFRELSFRELRWVCGAWLALPFIRMLVTFGGFQKAVRWLDDPDASDPRLSDEDVEKLARAIRSAASNHFLTLNCLPQSLWICNRLSRFGVPHVLRLGVSSIDAGALRAHAWVEAAGRKLNEPEAADSQATPFDRPHQAGGDSQ
jgi:hypothetical protein